MTLDSRIQILETEVAVIVQIAPNARIRTALPGICMIASALVFGPLVANLWLTTTKDITRGAAQVAFVILLILFANGVRLLHGELCTRSVHFERYAIGTQTRWMAIRTSTRWYSTGVISDFGFGYWTSKGSVALLRWREAKVGAIAPLESTPVIGFFTRKCEWVPLIPGISEPSAWIVLARLREAGISYRGVSLASLP